MSKPESENVITSITENPVYVSYLSALMIKDLSILKTDVQNSDFEQGFNKARELAIKIAKSYK